MGLNVKDLAARLASLREERGYTMAELARQSGLPRSNLYKIASGASPHVRASTLHALARVLDSSVAELVGEAQVGGGRSGRTSKSAGAHIPKSLLQFVSERKRRGEKIPDELVETFAYLRYRGRRPGSAGDWHFLYEALERCTRRGERHIPTRGRARGR
jgi:transcriptional regulator with XRE-family HTH domain